MSLSALSDRAAVLAAIAKFDAFGRMPFLRKYGRGRARTYVLSHNGKLYDSKAIVGVAHGRQFPDAGPLRSADFSGGEATVRAKLQELGFTVIALGDDPVRARGQSVPGGGAVWAEVTSLEHGHGGTGWELGRWLWSLRAPRLAQARWRSSRLRPCGRFTRHNPTPCTRAARPKARSPQGWPGRRRASDR